MNLKLYIRQNAIYDLNNNQQYYSGTNPQNLTPTIGALPVSRQWANYPAFIDITNNVSDLHKIKLTWSTQRDANGNTASLKNELKKAASGTLTFERTAYALIKHWLVEDVSASLNSVEVMIEDTTCGRYEGYVINSQDVQWCEGEVCEYSLILKQKDELYSCIQRTVITDNHKGWFQKVPANGKKHPRFSYCNEVRPNSMLVIEWYLLSNMFTTNVIFLMPMVLLAINPILFILQLIQNILGQNWNIPGPIGIGDLVEGISTIFIESAGCGREHPAALVRDYITNVCDKCGITVNSNTAPIFFAKTITINTSTGVETGVNEYYNAAYLNAPVIRGLRRFRKMNIGTGFSQPNNEYWIPGNDALLNLPDFLDKVLQLFNHEWRISNGELIIKRKDEMSVLGYMYDFTKGSPDTNKIVEGICFESNGEKYPASANGIYMPDGADSCGNEAGNVNGAGHMNGAVSFVQTDINNNNKPVNPNFEGILNKYSEFGATKFRFDGTSGDYIFDALQVVLNGSIFGLYGATVTMLRGVARNMDDYADNVLLLQSETAIQPKLIIWDGASYENARAIKVKAAWDGVAPQPMPSINPNYNDNLTAWKARHPPETDVKGKGLTFPFSPNGIYRVTDFFGILIDESPAILMNYPMFFEPFYKGTLWDRFHYIDDPNVCMKANKTWSVKIRLCCEDLEKLKVLNDAAGVVLNERVKLPSGYFTEGIIKEITVSYDPEDESGRYIELKGIL